MSDYVPPIEILEKYANLLINFALKDGKGIQPGESVIISVPESAKPMYVPLRNAALRAGAHPFMQYIAEDVAEAQYFEIASDNQLDNFFDKYYRGLTDQFDHSVVVLADFDKYALKEADPEKIMRKQSAYKPYRKWREEKEVSGNFTWTLGMYGTAAMALDAGMSLEEYWNEIIAACYLDQEDPISCWKAVWQETDQIKGKLDALDVNKLHITCEGTDLIVGIGAGRKWLSGSGRNIPSFELFISPDCRMTQGRVAFNQPLFYMGKKMENIWLVFDDGVVVDFGATSGVETLKEMLLIENGNRIGEFSLTDSRHSRISRFMGETLFDENMGQPYGNMHLAIGNAYKEAYPEDMSALTDEDWNNLGYNQSNIHVDIISTLQKEVTAILEDGSQILIYKDGNFVL